MRVSYLYRDRAAGWAKMAMVRGIVGREPDADWTEKDSRYKARKRTLEWHMDPSTEPVVAKKLAHLSHPDPRLSIEIE